MEFNEEFWDNRYKTNAIGWDLGSISSPLKAYFDQLENKKTKILIPGGGNSYEAEYLHKHGFKNVYVIDVSETALNNIKKRVPTFPSTHLIHQNFFDLKGQFDVIIEQTFFCALAPKLRIQYVKQANNLLTKRGKMVGLLFNLSLNIDHPPFGGHKDEYLSLFSTHFQIETMAPCYNSEPSRENKELFVKLIKKENH